MQERDVSKRYVLRAMGVVGSVALAGCSGDEGPGDENGDDEHEDENGEPEDENGENGENESGEEDENDENGEESDEPGTLVVLVMDEEAFLIEDATVTLTGDDVDESQEVEDGEATFEDVEPGEYTLVTEPEDDDLESDEREVTVEGGTETNEGVTLHGPDDEEEEEEDDDDENDDEEEDDENDDEEEDDENDDEEDDDDE